MTEALALALMILGIFFLFVATIGFVRFPDIYCRLHVTGVIDTLGVPLMLLGTAVYLGPEWTSGKLMLALVFLYLTSPLVAHLLARSALQAGRKPAPETIWTPDRRPPGSKPAHEAASSKSSDSEPERSK